ncbi:hypothetical protein [Cohnella thailandensis]|uniref:Uncharacterized protein n=1 Tax=Cohnella thailandensis TaxID=557557 RepID=A0A841SVL6_9BACL|nr:hypothetical protein [Cohnella thailandensis]MBB6632741.1 hypothetical protein [Cohnella thailandensis]MBP1975570.1 ribosomal protein S19 [Cohnella thailandensis]
MSKPLVPKIGHPNEEEMYMLRESILLPAILQMLDRKLKQTEWSTDMLKTLYKRAIELLIDRVLQDHITVRKSLRERKIKTWDGDNTDFAIYVNYNCRGYDGNFFVTRDVARAEISVRLGKYIQDAFTPMSNQSKCFVN